MEQSPTRVRWFVLAVTTLSSVLLYLDRICVSFAVESIRIDFQASQQQMGWFLGAFFWSYALGQVPAGWLSDRFGIRRMLSIYILLWSAFTALLGLSTGVITLIGYRLGCGLAQAGAYPSCARAVRDWMPLMQRGTASSVVAFGGRMGGAVAPLLTGALMLFLATRSAGPELQPSEVLDARRLASELLAGGDPAASRWQVLVWEQLDDIERAAVSDIASVDDKAATAEDRQRLAAILNRITLAELLAATASDAATGLSPEIERRFLVESAEISPVNRRQLWETLYPSTLRKLEARGWRQTLVIYGSFGIVVAAVFWWIFRNTPRRHPWCNADEVALIEGPAPLSAASNDTAPSIRETRFPWGAILTSVSLWGNCVCQFTTNVGWVFLVTWLPRYLEEVHRVPVLERGLMASVPIFAGMLGMIAGGPWTDRLTRAWGLRWGRRVPVATSRVIAASGYGLCVLVAFGFAGSLGTATAAWTAVAGLSIVAIATDLGVAATWAYAQDVAARHTAAVLGWGNMWGNLGAAVAPPLSGLLLGEAATLADWNLLFGFCAGAFLVSAVGGWLMDASRPLESGGT